MELKDDPFLAKEKSNTRGHLGGELGTINKKEIACSQSKFYSLDELYSDGNRKIMKIRKLVQI